MMNEKTESVLVLRTCNPDLTSYADFQWPAEGPVEAPTKWWKAHTPMPSDLVLGWDENRECECGGGLHGLLWGEGNGLLLNLGLDSKWLVVRVKASDIRASTGKVRFPAGVVVHCGDKKSATDYLLANGAAGKSVVGASVTAGDYGTATAGDEGTATAGYEGTATAGYEGTATAGDYGTATAGGSGTATAGYKGTATAGYEGTATAGNCGILQIHFWDGARCRIKVAYVGENGIQPGKAYRLNGAGVFTLA